MSTHVQQRLQVLKDNDRVAHDALQDSMPDVSARLEDEIGMAELVDLLCQISAEAPECSVALINRLVALPPAALRPAILRKWAFDGLQRYRKEPIKRLRHFAATDPSAFGDRDTVTDAEHLLTKREELLHYLAGLGCADMRLELHEPGASSLATQRVTVGQELLLLPRRFGEFSDSARERLYRAAAAHAAAHLRFSVRGRQVGNRPPLLIAVTALIEDARVERLMARSYPGLQGLWGLFHIATRADAGFDFAGLTARLARALHDPCYADSNSWVNKGRKLFAQAAVDLDNVAAFDKVGRLLAIDIEKMRLSFKTQTYRIEPAYRDDNTFLWDFNPPSATDDRETVVREKFELKQRDPDHLDTERLRRVEVDQRRRVHYPEWDYKAAAVRENWATVIEAAPRIPAGRRAQLPRAASAGLRFRGLARIPDRSIRVNRLEEGDELDLNAAIDSIISRRRRDAPDPRIFRRHGRRRRSTAIVLLMDLSESTKRFVPGSFTSVLEAEKRAATLVAESLDSSRDRVAVHGFSSNGRAEVNYVSIKEFDEPFGAEEKQRLRVQEGQLSTRMGAALRHASSALASEDADRKVILLLTDGEPSDIDIFEEDYLVEDSRHAVITAAAQGIQTFCLTLDGKADVYVRRIFGTRNYLIADKADGFAGHTGQALAKLIAH